MIFFISPAFVPLVLGALGLDYLRRTLLPSVPPTSPVGEPYELPFTGGQCTDRQYIVTGNDIVSGGYTGSTSFSLTLQGAIGKPYKEGSNWYIPYQSGSNRINRGGGSWYGIGFDVIGVNISSVTPVGGGADPCGDIPNPNPVPPIPDDGLADSPAFNEAGSNLVLAGAPLVPIAGVAAAIRALLTALAAINNVLDAIKTIGDILGKFNDILDDIRKFLDDLLKKDKSKKDIYKYDYGSISEDGFLRLYPSSPPEGFEPEYIDLQLLSIPIGYGKYFGKKSPNFYRFKSLGYISFVSPSFGILESHELEFGRCSLNIPPNCLGFFYHLGLDGQIKANVSLFYLKNKPSS